MLPIIAHKGKIISDSGVMTQYPSGEPMWKPRVAIPDGSVIGFQWRGNINDIVAFCSWMSINNHTPFGCTAVIPFLPCSRQHKDSPVDGDQSRGVPFILDMLQNCSGLDKVVVLDNHSTVGFEHREDFIENQPLSSLLYDMEFDLVVSPDAGSLIRSHAVAELNGAPVICAKKVRNQATGSITSYSFPVAVGGGYDRILVVDDIIDGGYTFMLLGEQLRESWPNAEITLACTHGVFGSYPPLVPSCLAFYDSVILTNSCENAVEVAKRVENKITIIEVVERMTIERSLLNA